MRLQDPRPAARPGLLFLEHVEGNVVQWPIFAGRVLRQENANFGWSITANPEAIPRIHIWYDQFCSIGVPAHPSDPAAFVVSCQMAVSTTTCTSAY